MFCFKVFRLANEFIRYAEINYKDETGTKTTYIKEMHDVLNRRINSELALAKITYLSTDIESGSKKRV